MAPSALYIRRFRRLALGFSLASPYVNHRPKNSTSQASIVRSTYAHRYPLPRHTRFLLQRALHRSDGVQPDEFVPSYDPALPSISTPTLLAIRASPHFESTSAVSGALIKTPLIIAAVTLGLVVIITVGRILLRGRKHLLPVPLLRVVVRSRETEGRLAWSATKASRNAGRAPAEETGWNTLAKFKSTLSKFSPSSSLEEYLNNKYTSPRIPAQAVLHSDPVPRRREFMPSLLSRPPGSQLQRPVSWQVYSSTQFAARQPDLYTIYEGDEDQDEQVPVEDLENDCELSYSLSTNISDAKTGSISVSWTYEFCDDTDITHSLNAALQNYASSVDTLASTPHILAEDTRAAAMALRAGIHTVNVRARMTGRPPTSSNASTTLSVDDNDSAGFASDDYCSPPSSVTSFGSSSSVFDSEEDDVVFEVRRVETRSMEFNRGMVVSLSVISGVPYYLAANTDTHSGTSGTENNPNSKRDEMRSLSTDFEANRQDSVYWDDFPAPPMFSSGMKSMSTTLSLDFERSFREDLAGNPYTWRRVLSAPDLHTSRGLSDDAYLDLVRVQGD